MIGASVTAPGPQGSIEQVILHMLAIAGLLHQAASLEQVVNSRHVVLSAIKDFRLASSFSDNPKKWKHNSQNIFLNHIFMLSYNKQSLVFYYKGTCLK